MKSRLSLLLLIINLCMKDPGVACILVLHEKCTELHGYQDESFVAGKYADLKNKGGGED